MTIVAMTSHSMWLVLLDCPQNYSSTTTTPTTTTTTTILICRGKFILLMKNMQNEPFDSTRGSSALNIQRRLNSLGSMSIFVS